MCTAGKLKALGITTLKSSELLPGVKSVAEQGVPGFEMTAWNAFYAPAGTPKPIIDLLNAEVTKILAQPDTRQRLLQTGLRTRRRHARVPGEARGPGARQMGAADQGGRAEGRVGAMARGPPRPGDRGASSLMIMRDADLAVREEYDAPLEWRAPSALSWRP